VAVDNEKALKIEFAVILAIVLLGWCQLAHLAWHSLVQLFWRLRPMARASF
jgi:hypothetical protein